MLIVETKFIINKTNTGPRRKNAWTGIKVTQKIEMLPVTLVGSLYKTHAVLCSKIADKYGI